MKEIFKKLRFIITKSELKKLTFLSFGTLLLSLSEAFSIGIIIPIISLFLAPEKVYSSKWLGKLYNLTGIRNEYSFLGLLIIIAFTLFLFKACYAVFMLYQQQNIIGGIYNRLTSRTLKSYLTKPYIFHLVNNSSVLFKNINSEVSGFVYYFLSPIILIFSEIIVLAGICLLLFLVYPIIVLFLIGIIVIITLFSNYFYKRRIRGYAKQRELFSEQLYKTALESLNSVKEIQIYNAYDFFVKKYLESTKKYTNAFMKFSVLSGLPRYVFEAILFTFILAAILLSLYFRKAPTEVIPMLTVIGVASLRLLPAFSKIYGNVGFFHYGLNSFEIVYKILQEERIPETESKDILIDNKNIQKQPSICLENVLFRYDTAASSIFENFNLVIPLDQIVAFVGKTGSGKSTLIDIIMGLLVPQQGALYYLREMIAKGNLAEYRKKIGYVPQNLFLIDETIATNIAFGIPQENIEPKRLEFAIKVSQLESFIKSLPEGINTQIGEKGIRISGGQRQRIGIARALYRNPSILILDEATSALDIQTERNLYNAIISVVKTIIIVSHRPSTIERADIIYIMDNGRVVECGNFKELSEKSELFKEIAKEESPLENYDYQTGGIRK